MNSKVKNMIGNMQHLHTNGEELKQNVTDASKTLLEKSRQLLQKVDLKNPRTQLVAAGAAGLVAAAGIAYYLVNRNNRLA